MFGVLSSSAETKLILGAQGELNACHDLFNQPPLLGCGPCPQSLLPLPLFLSVIDWHYGGCQWGRAGIGYHVFHESSWFGVESPYNLLSRLRGFRAKGEAVNYSSSTGISQACLRQTRKRSHPSLGELEPRWFVMVQTDGMDVCMSVCGLPVTWGSWLRGLREVCSLVCYVTMLF